MNDDHIISRPRRDGSRASVEILSWGWGVGQEKAEDIVCDLP